MIDFNRLKRKELGDSLSFKTKIIRPQLRYITEDVGSHIKNMNYDNQFITCFRIYIYLIDLDTDKDIEVGAVAGCFITPEEFRSCCNFLDICDCVGGDLLDLAEEITDESYEIRKDICDDTDCIAYVGDIYIKRKYRGYGIGSFVLQELHEILLYHSREFITKIFLQPQPRVVNRNRKIQNISDKNKSKCRIEKELMDFYFKNGFKKIEGTKYLVKKGF